MTWFNSKPGESEFKQIHRLATRSDIRAVFKTDRDALIWMAFVITGNTAWAEESVVDATELTTTESVVFQVWLTKWAHTATARAAIRMAQAQITASASRYSECSCEHSDHEVLSDDQIASAVHVDPKDIVAELDPLARSVLVLRGLHRVSIPDCVLLMEVPRRAVTGAYCRALQWINDRISSRAGAKSPAIGLGLAS